MSEAMKYDNEKVRLDLLPVIPLIGVGKVLTFGAHKYGARNWEKGLDWSRCYGAALRHLFAWWSGETNDPETGYNHLDHALCELMFLREFAETHPELDDRPNNSAVAALKHMSEKEQCAPAEAETPKTLLDVVRMTIPEMYWSGGCPGDNKFRVAFFEAGYEQPTPLCPLDKDGFSLGCEKCWNRPAKMFKPVRLDPLEAIKPEGASLPSMFIKSWSELVKEFNGAYGIHTSFTAPTRDAYLNSLETQMKLICEELGELGRAYGRWCSGRADEDKEEILDGICDSIYVLIGLGLKMGMDVDGAFREVHRSNMSKLGEDRKPIKRSDGKILKGPHYQPPNLKPFI